MGLALAGCGTGAAQNVGDRIIDDTRDAGDAVSAMVDTAQEAAAGSGADVERALARAERTIEALTEYTEVVSGGSEVGGLLATVVESGNEVVALVRQGNVDGADRVRSDDFMQASNDLVWIIDSGPADLITESEDADPNMFPAIVVVVVVVGAFALFRAGVRKKAEDQIEQTSPPVPTYVPSGSGGEPAGGQPVGIGVRRWLRSGTESVLATADLGDLLERAVRHHRQSGWPVTIESPPLSVIVDAERLEKVVGTLVAGASLRGAPHVGLTAAGTDALVTVAIVDDGPLDGEDSGGDDPGVPPWVHRQLAALEEMLLGSDISADWMNEDDLSVFVLSWQPIEVVSDDEAVASS